MSVICRDVPKHLNGCTMFNRNDKNESFNIFLALRCFDQF